jgi:hypothetical protein
LVADVEDGVIHRLEPLLTRASFSFDLLPLMLMVEELIDHFAFDILIFGYPCEDPEAAELLERIRRPESPCQRSAVLWVCAAEDVDEIKALSAGVSGYVGVIDVLANQEDLEDEVARILKVAPRFAARRPIHLNIRCADGHVEALSQTENVSNFGMLVRIEHEVEIGSTLVFEILTDGASIHGHAKAVRIARDGEGKQVGVGFLFLDFIGDGADRFTLLLNQTEA